MSTENNKAQYMVQDENGNWVPAPQPVQATSGQPKKKHTLGIVLAVLAVVIVGCTVVFGSEPDNSSSKTEEVVSEQVEIKETGKASEEVEGTIKEEEKVVSASNEPNTGIDAMLLGDPDYDKYIHMGSSFTNKSGVTMDIVNIDYKVFNVGELKTTEICVVADITNNSDSAVSFDQNDALLYIDDYEASKGSTIDVYMSNGYYMARGNVSYPVYATANVGGRKAQIAFITQVTNKQVNENSEIEFEISGLIFKINPLVILGEVDTSDNDIFGNSNSSDSKTDSRDDGIGNPIIDADPDRYVPEGVSGEIDVIDGTFYSNKPTSGAVSGEYLIVGGGSSVVVIDGDKMSLKLLGGEVDFENAVMEELINSPDGCSYQVYGNGQGYVVSFYEGGLYLHTDMPDTEDDYAEGFYEKL